MSHTTESNTKKATRRVLASQARTIPSPSPILSANQLTPVAIHATVKQGHNGPLCYVAESRALNPDNAACTFADITWLREQLLLPRLIEQPLDELAMTRAKSRSGMFKVQNFVKKSIWHIFASNRATWIWHASFWLLFVVPDKLLCCCSLDVRPFTVTCLNLRSFGSHLCFALKNTKLISILDECKLSRSMECKGKPSTRERSTTDTKECCYQSPRWSQNGPTHPILARKDTVSPLSQSLHEGKSSSPSLRGLREDCDSTSAPR
jgi:hypothetical protein